MANALTGRFDVVAEFGLEAVNRVLAAQHQDGTYFHSLPAERRGEGLPWARIDDPSTGVRGLAQIQVSTPTVTLPAGEGASRITIHFQLMAHMVPDRHSAAVPEFVHGELQVAADVARHPTPFGLVDADTIEIDLAAEDLEVVFTPAPDPDAPLSDEETARVSQIIRNVLMTGFEPVTTVVDLPGRGQDLRVQHWWFKTMPGDQQPVVALLLSLTAEEPKAGQPDPDPDDVREVFLDEEDDFAIAFGRDFLESRLRRIIQGVLPDQFEVEVTADLLFRTLQATYDVSLRLDGMTVKLGDGQIDLSVGGVARTEPWWAPNFDFEVGQAFSLSIEDNHVVINFAGDPAITVKLHGFDLFGVIKGQARGMLRDQVRDRREGMRVRANAMIRHMLTAQPLQNPESGPFGDFMEGLRISHLSVNYTSTDITTEGVVLHGALGLGNWNDVVATYETKSTWPSNTIFLLAAIGAELQVDLDQGALSQQFRELLQRFQEFPLSHHEIITTEEEGRQWRIEDQGRTYTVVRVGDLLEIYGIDIRKIDYEFNAFNSWIPGGTVQQYRWVYSSDDEILWSQCDEHKFKGVRTEDLPPIDAGGGNFLQLCLEVSGLQGSPSNEVSGSVCSGFALALPQVEAAEGGGHFVELSDSEGKVVAHFDPFWREPSLKLRPGGPGRRRGGAANLLVHFFDSESAQTWPLLRDTLAGWSRQNTAVFVVAVVPPGLVVEPLKLESNISWARTEDAEQAWEKTFCVTARPATFMVNPQGKIVWQHAGRYAASAFITAFDEHLVAGGPLRWQQLLLSVRAGQPAPDFVFQYQQGRRIALRRLRRRPVFLVFWKSWSAPCLAELHRLQGVYERRASEGLVVLAVHDGEDRQRAREAFSRGGFTFDLVFDPDRHIAGLYGVRCWPSTVSIDGAGAVRRIQFGTAPDSRTGMSPKARPAV